MAGKDCNGLAYELEDTAMGVGLAGQHAGVVDQELGGEVVGAVDDKVIVGDNGTILAATIHSL